MKRAEGTYIFARPPTPTLANARALCDLALRCSVAADLRSNGYTSGKMTDSISKQVSEAGSEAAPGPATPNNAAHQAVTRDEVRHVAALASLELTPAEETSMERDLNAILGYIAELNELDTSDVEPMAQVSEILARRTAEASSAGLRADEPHTSLPRATVMAVAPATDGSFFKVPKVIER